MLTLCVEPATTPLGWEEFMSAKPKNSIALDGYVKAGPRFDPTGPWANYNHHEEVSRLETRATCHQVLLAIRMGLFETFQDSIGNPDANVYVNDCDEDVSLSWFLLEHHNLVRASMNPILNRLVFMEDMLDTTAGAYPFPRDMESLEQLMWIFEPYHQFRVSGQIDRREEQAFRSVIDDVGRRIIAHVMGKGHHIRLDTRFKVIATYPQWVLIQEIGKNARIGVYNEGIKAFVSVRERPTGAFSYGLNRFSHFVPFPLLKFIQAFNAAEPHPSDMWGGSDNSAGSPRVRGSRLKPEEVAEIINSEL